MKTIKDIAKEQQQNRPTYFDDPEKDRMVALVLELAEEVCVLNDRLATAERLAAEISTEAIDAYEPSAEEIEERLLRHQAFFERTLARLSG